MIPGFMLGVVCGVLFAAASAVCGVLLGGWIKRRSPACTGVAAVWCPNHGDCSCPGVEGGWRDMNDDACPLHSRRSDHAEPLP